MIGSGRIAACKTAVSCLGEVDQAVAKRVTAVADMPHLRQLLREAATAVTMTAFVERVDELTQDD